MGSVLCWQKRRFQGIVVEIRPKPRGAGFGRALPVISCILMILTFFFGIYAVLCAKSVAIFF